MNCEIIRDLLPLYADKCCSEETCREVEKHLSECAECADIYDKMSSELSGVPVSAVPKRMKKVCHWKASVLQSILFYFSFAVITAGVALEAATSMGLINGFWAFALIIPATGFMLSLANWYFIRLYKSSRIFSNCCVIATAGITLFAFVWACFHYDVNLFSIFSIGNSETAVSMFGALLYYFIPGVILTAVLCVVSKLASKKYASLIGKE